MIVAVNIYFKTLSHIKESNKSFFLLSGRITSVVKLFSVIRLSPVVYNKYWLGVNMNGF